MSKEASFDIVSEVDFQEVDNAVHQTQKELSQRYDFKGSKSKVTLNKEAKKLTVLADDDMKLLAIKDILETKFSKRGISAKAVKYGKEEEALGGSIRVDAEIVSGIPQENTKKIVKLIKELKIKVQATIQKDQVRVQAKSRDDLQFVIQALKESTLDIPLQFTNYR